VSPPSGLSLPEGILLFSRTASVRSFRRHCVLSEVSTPSFWKAPLFCSFWLSGVYFRQKCTSTMKDTRVTLLWKWSPGTLPYAVPWVQLTLSFFFLDDPAWTFPPIRWPYFQRARRGLLSPDPRYSRLRRNLSPVSRFFVS